MTNAWEKTGRDAAHEDIAGGAEPCTTLDEARRRIGQWLRSQTPAVAAADAEACAAAYLRAWEAHARDTSPAGLDLDDGEIDLAAPICPMEPSEAETWLAEIDAARGDCDPSAEARAGYRIEAALRGVLQQRAVRDATAQAFDDLVAQVWRATGETHEPTADVAALLARVAAARREGAEAMREACLKAAEWGDDERFDGCHAVDVQEIIEGAIRALPLPGGEP